MESFWMMVILGVGWLLGYRSGYKEGERSERAHQIYLAQFRKEHGLD